MEEPPSYDSLFGKIAAAKVTSDGNVDFARKSIGILCGSVIATILLVLSLAVPIAAIVIGGLYLHDCPKQKYIPIYLIVFGSFSIVKALSSLVDNCRARKNEGQQDENKPKSACDGIIGCFLFAWFIAELFQSSLYYENQIESDTRIEYAFYLILYANEYKISDIVYGWQFFKVN
ncbi:unnamed protein product [Mytilus coruscus]|uniref:Uncharacterized protein n=1 Tax=Mytilus coruscus TaxID=42192 RepID=A0A6J8DMX4_MYTCO|nr:unnamed protein product [Mytilus coruscus]